MQQPATPDDVMLGADERARLRELITTSSETVVAAALRISRQTLGRSLAGLPLRRGSVALIRARLHLIDAMFATSAEPDGAR